MSKTYNQTLYVTEAAYGKIKHANEKGWPYKWATFHTAPVCGGLSRSPSKIVTVCDASLVIKVKTTKRRPIVSRNGLQMGRLCLECIRSDPEWSTRMRGKKPKLGRTDEQDPTAERYGREIGSKPPEQMRNLVGSEVKDLFLTKKAFGRMMGRVRKGLDHGGIPFHLFPNCTSITDISGEPRSVKAWVSYNGLVGREGLILGRLCTHCKNNSEWFQKVWGLLQEAEKKARAEREEEDRKEREKERKRREERKRNQHRCWFCGKTRKDAALLISGKATLSAAVDVSPLYDRPITFYICDDCVATSADLCAKEVEDFDQRLIVGLKERGSLTDVPARKVPGLLHQIQRLMYVDGNMRSAHHFIIASQDQLQAGTEEGVGVMLKWASDLASQAARRLQEYSEGYRPGRDEEGIDEALNGRR